jgi:eukaryotic-like serine/threonine-protein kinase
MVDVGGAPLDRYVVTEYLSEGGMGAILVGKKLGAGGFEMEVVLKRLLPEFTQQEEFLDLFIREAKLSATLDHANIVHTIDFVTANNEYFIVMEYLPGGDLRSLLKKAKRRGKRFSPAAAIRICREVLSALAYAHVKRDFDGKPLKLIHRDVSPSNILVSYTGEVKLTDFGIAKAATHNSLFYKVKGKVGYMSPEQARSETLDHRSDLYSLAVCLYEVITGERLFVHAGLTTSADEIYSQPVPQVSRKVPGLTPDFDAIMAKALAISPDKRYQTAGEFQEALTRCAHRNGLLVSAPELAAELRDACGDFEQWRSDDEEEEAAGAPRAGTEVYDAADDEDEDEAEAEAEAEAEDEDGGRGRDDDDDLGLGPVSIHSIAARASEERGVRPKTEVSRFHGVELTSIINMIDLEGAEGARSFDLGSGPRSVDSGPRSVDSGPRSGGSGPRGGDPSPLGEGTPGARPNLTQQGIGVPNVSDLAPTAPRQMPFPQAGPQWPMPMQGQAPMQAQPQRPPLSMQQARPPQQQPSLAPRPAPQPGQQRRASSASRRKPSRIRPWLVIALILILTGTVAILVAMSGPDVPAVPAK